MQKKKSVWLKDGRWACTNHCPAAVFPKTADKCLLGCDIHRPETQMTPSVYEKWRLVDLRQYAQNELGIKGATRIRGGKKALIEIIMKRNP